MAAVTGSEGEGGPRKAEGWQDDEGEKEPGRAEGGRSCLLLGTGNVLLHVVQGTLGDALLQNQILQLMPIAVVLDAGCNFTEAVQEDLIITTVIFIIPGGKSKDPGV